MLSKEELVKPVRLIGFGVSGLGDTPGQMLLFAGENQGLAKREKLSEAVDSLRSQFGGGAVRSGGAGKENRDG